VERAVVNGAKVVSRVRVVMEAQADKDPGRSNQSDPNQFIHSLERMNWPRCSRH
jgi:hypothetical protein